MFKEIFFMSSRGLLRSLGITMPLLDSGQRCLAVNRHVFVTGHNDDLDGVQQAPVEFPMRVFPIRGN